MKEKMKALKINGGAKTHIGIEYLTALGHTDLKIYCGSGEGQMARGYRQVSGNVEEVITCKKCLKAYQNGKAEEKFQMLEDLGMLN